MRRVLVLLLALGLVGLGCNLATLKPANTPTPQEAALQGESTATVAQQTAQAMMPAPARSTPPPAGTASGAEAAVSAQANTAAPEATVPPAVLRPGELTVTYVVAGDIYVWQPGTHPRRLTEHGQAREVYLSTDAAWIAYTKAVNDTRVEIWALRSDGSQDKPLVILDDLKTSNPTQWLYPAQIAWMPDSHTIYYTTVIRMEGPGAPPANDLRAADADSGQKATLLQPGAGGRFYLSPDGQKLLLVQADRFRMANRDGSGAADLFTYPYIYTYSDWVYLPDPVWLPDAKAFRVILPPQDSLGHPDEPTLIWEIPADGSPARQLGQFTAVPAWYARPLLSPDGQRVAYQTQEKPGEAVTGLHIATVDLGSDLVLQSGEVKFENWSPDGARVTVWSNLRQELQLATLDGKFSNWPVGIKPFALRWVDGKSFLVLSGKRETPELYYGTVEGQFVRLASAQEPGLAFDFVK